MADHKQFLAELSKFVPRDRIYTDDLRLLCWGTDAGFYRLLPKIVVRSKDESEVARILQLAHSLNVPVTFRAAGTSLSGQAITDSVLVVAGKNWEKYTIGENALTITLQPGIIGERVNAILKPFGKEFAPDPASKNSAMVGGIVINNASGMSCGTHANSDKILRSIRIVLADGTVLDTGDPESRARFTSSHPEIIEGIRQIRDDILADPELTARIRHKYAIKNVTGLNLRPFVEIDDPIDIIAHCMVGSEGTLAFMSEVTVNTQDIMPYKASAMLYFKELRTACEAIVALKSLKVDAAELLDSKSLASVNDTTGTGLTAVLMQVKGETKEELDRRITEVSEALKAFELYKPAEFTTDPAVYGEYWKIRSGIFPAVGGTRPLGTTVLIEDVAFHIQDLPQATVELQQLLVDCGYPDACIYGHALEGNYHFIIAQSFDTPEEVERYKRLMQAVTELVVDHYDGSLKAEHGTGRNMAPFVKKEWGEKAWSMMRRLKDLLDPKGILNPGVIFNDDPECYIKQMKPLPLVHDKVNRCIECGFCEVNCVSCGYTLSARQRIVAQREISRLRTTMEDPKRYKRLIKQFRALGEETCAGDGLCSTSCPMHINVSDMIHDLRQIEHSHAAMAIGRWTGKHLSAVKGSLRPVLSTASAMGRVLGKTGVDAVGSALHHCGLPLWTPALPGAAHVEKIFQNPSERKVVYFPSCINQTMGATREKGGKPAQLTNVMVELCHKAGYEVIYPEGMNNLCCGMIWESKGMPDTAEKKIRELEAALDKASEHGRYPVLCDQSPCLHRMRENIKSMKLYEPVEFILDYLAPYLTFTPTDEHIAIHVTCSSRLMGLAGKMEELARRCSTHVLVPTEVGCCGFAGDKGFTHPGLNKFALRKLRPQIEKERVTHGYSNSRTCEIGLTTNSGVPYKSIAYLVNQVTKGI